MRKILFIFAAVLLVTCSGNDDPEEDTRIPLLVEIPTEYNFRGSDFSDEYIDQVVPFTYHMQAGDKVFFCVKIKEVDPDILPSTYTDYRPIFSVATLNVDDIWTVDPPIMLPSETIEAYISAIYYGGGEFENCLELGAPLFNNGHSQLFKKSINIDTPVKINLASMNPRMLFTKVGKGKKVWFDDKWTKYIVQVNNETGKITQTYTTPQPNYIETNENGDAVVYLIYSHTYRDMCIAITDANSNEPDNEDDAAWHLISEVWDPPLVSFFSTGSYNYVVDCSEVSNK